MLPMYVPGRGAVDSFADDVGMPHNAVRLVVGLVLGCVLAPLSHVVMAPTSRHALNTLLGVSIGWFVFDFNLVHSLVPTLLTYGLMSFAPRELVGPVASAILFMHLIACHAYRELLGADIIWDGAQMVLTLKLAGTAMSYSDAVLPLNQKTPSILRNQVTAKPSLLSVLGYVYFFPTFLVGPIFELNDYLAWTDDAQVAPVAVILPKLGTLILCIAGHAASEVLFPIMTMDAPPYYASHAFPARFVLQLAATMFYKFRFYMVWQFGEVGGVLAGYGYDPNTHEWDGLCNNNLLLVEFPVNLRVAVNNWNIKVATWLHTYIYQRVGHKQGKPTFVSTLNVFVASALWHGLLPGYYAFFIVAGLGVEVGRRVALSWVMINYCAPSFVWLDMTRCFNWWATVYYAPHVMIVVALVLFTGTAAKSTKKSD